MNVKQEKILLRIIKRCDLTQETAKKSSAITCMGYGVFFGITLKFYHPEFRLNHNFFDFLDLADTFGRCDGDEFVKCCSEQKKQSYT